ITGGARGQPVTFGATGPPDVRIRCHAGESGTLEAPVVSQASRLADVRYDIRGPVLARARELEAQGHEIIKLNIGNPAPFGLFSPDAVLEHVTASVAGSQGYSDARGILEAREAVTRYYTRRGVHGVTPDHVYLGNGVSELIVMSLQALLNPGDEVL